MMIHETDEERARHEESWRTARLTSRIQTVRAQEAGAWADLRIALRNVEHSARAALLDAGHAVSFVVEEERDGCIVAEHHAASLTDARWLAADITGDWHGCAIFGPLTQGPAPWAPNRRRIHENEPTYPL